MKVRIFAVAAVIALLCAAGPRSIGQDANAPAAEAKPSIVLVCTDENGAPLADKEIVVTVRKGEAQFMPIKGAPEPPRPVVKVGKTGADGTFSLGEMETDTLSLTASLEGYAKVSTATMRYQAGGHRLPFTFIPSGSVKGRVVDAETGAPVADTSVNAGNMRATTDKNGAFEFKSLPAGPIKINIWSTRLETTDEAGTPVTVQAGKTSEVIIKVIVRKQSSLECAIQLPDETPLKDAEVWLLDEAVGKAPESWSKMWFKAWEKTNEEGVFSSNNITAGRRKITLFVKGYAPVRFEERDFKPGEMWKIGEAVRLSKGLGGEVVVKDADGKPLAGARVIAQAFKNGSVHYYDIELFGSVISSEPGRPAGGEMNYPLVFKTNEAGVAEVSGLEEGATAFVAVAENHIPSECKLIEIKKGEKITLDFTLAKPVKAKVKVTDAGTGKPIENARVLEWDDPARSKGLISVSLVAMSGSESVECYSKRPYVIATAEGYGSGWAAVEPKGGEAEVSISLRKTGTGSLSGKLVPPPGEKLDPALFVILQPLRLGWMPSDRTLLTVGADGGLKVGELNEGAWWIQVRDANDGPAGYEYFEIRKGENTEVSVRIAAAGAAEITVLGPNRKPVTDAEVTIKPSDMREELFLSHATGLFGNFVSEPQRVTDEKGICKIGRLRAGKYEVSVKAAGLAAPFRQLEIEAGKTVSPTINLVKGATVEGKLFSSNYRGSRVALLSDRVDPLDMLRFDIATQADVMPGEEFRLTDIAPGKYRLAAVSNYGPTVSTYFLPVEVKAGETIKVADLKSPEKVQEFSGRLKKDTRGGFESPRLVALLGPCVSMASVRPDGTFEGQAPPGKYRVYYSSFSTLMLKRELSEAGEIVIEEGKDLTGIEIP